MFFKHILSTIAGIFAILVTSPVKHFKKTGVVSRFRSFYRIIAGLFVPDRRLPLHLKMVQVLSRFSWEIIQTTIGIAIALGMALCGEVRGVLFSHGATVVQCKGRFGAFTLGLYITGDREINGSPRGRLFQHEYGHYLQSMRAGFVYVFKYGLPSLISAYRNGFYNHARHPVEQDANIRARAYFQKHYGIHGTWDHKYNPLYPEVSPCILVWLDFMPVYFPLVHLVKAFEK